MRSGRGPTERPHTAVRTPRSASVPLAQAPVRDRRYDGEAMGAPPESEGLTSLTAASKVTPCKCCFG